MKKICSISLVIVCLLLTSLLSNAQITYEPDTTFNYGGYGITGSSINNLIINADKSMYVGGNYGYYNGVVGNDKFLKLSEKGLYDNAFLSNHGIINTIVSALEKQSDEKILAAGYFQNIGGVLYNRIVRFNVDGTIDNTFKLDTLMYNAPSPFSGNVVFIAEVKESSNKIYIGGDFKFRRYGVPRFQGIMMIEMNGKMDTVTFNPGTGAGGGSVTEIEVQPDGKILVGGGFTTFDDVSKNCIVRLNANGTIDNSFVTGTGFLGGTVNKIVVLSNGKILVGGNFTSYNGQNVSSLVRLNDDGTLDNTFQIGIGFFESGSAINPIVDEIKITTDNKILISGLFDQFDGSPAKSMIRLNENGTRDSDFIFPSTLGRVETFEYQYPDKLIITGVPLSHYYDIPSRQVFQYGVIRLNEVPYVTSVSSKINKTNLKIYPNPSAGKLSIDIPEGEQIEELSIVNSLGQMEVLENRTYIESTMKGLVYVFLKTNKGNYEGKVVLE